VYIKRARQYIATAWGYRGLWAGLILVLGAGLGSSRGSDYVGPYYEKVYVRDGNNRGGYQTDLRESLPQFGTLLGIHSDSVITTSSGWLWFGRGCLIAVVVLAAYLMLVWPRRAAAREKRGTFPS
jgi:hypothetical protein